MNILALHLSHDGSITVIEGDEIVVHHQLDRYNKFKHEFIPSIEVLENIKKLNIKLDKVIITSLSPHGFPIKYFLKKFFNIGAEDIVEVNANEHHLFHAHCARHFYNYPKNSVYYVADGAGARQNLTHSSKFIDGVRVIEQESCFDEDCKPIFKNYCTSQLLNIENDKIKIHPSLGLGYAYQKLTYELGFEEFEDGKTMALSSYGKFSQNIRDCLLYRDNWNLNLLNKDPDTYDHDNKYNRFMLDPNIDHTTRDSKSLDFVHTFQKTFEYLTLKNIKKIKRPYDNLILTGGCAQNVLNNTNLKDELKCNVLADPFNGDFGISLGSALSMTKANVKPLKHICSGFETELDLSKLESMKVTTKEVATLLLNQPIAIMSGKSEQGQRGLGFRSLLANPVQKNILSIINTIKKREWFRPFACTILKEEAHKYFEINEGESSPYMMFVYKCKNPRLKNVCSVDNYSRIQTLEKSFHPKYYELIKSFKELSGIPVVLNTSLNLPGKVLVEDFDDLHYFLKNSNLKYCYLPDYKKLVWLK